LRVVWGADLRGMGTGFAEREEDRSASGVAISRLLVPAVGDAVGGLVWVHGLGDHAARYPGVFGEFARRGLVTVAGEFPGHGQSGGRRGHIASREDAHSVIDRSLARLRELVPDGRLGVGGHSMGALWLMDYFAAGKGADFEFVWLSSALVDPAYGQPLWKLWLGRMVEKVLPRLTISNGVRAEDCYELAATGGSVASERASGTHDRMSLRLGVELLRAGERVREQATSLFADSALLMSHGTADRVCPLGCARDVFDKFAAKDKQFLAIPGALHEPWADPEMVATVGDWIGERC